MKGGMLGTGASAERRKVRWHCNKSQNDTMCISPHLITTLVCSKGVTNCRKRGAEERKMPSDVAAWRQRKRGRMGEEQKALLMNINIYLHTAAARESVLQ